MGSPILAPEKQYFQFFPVRYLEAEQALSEIALYTQLSTFCNFND